MFWTIMLDINEGHISQLTDADLRTLIGRLCEAEFRGQGLSTARITYGGHQDAKDGGIDVRVAYPGKVPDGGHIPKANTGFQIKKSDMQPAAIKREMRPNNELRTAIRELADNKGAYIIVSSGDSATDSALPKRLVAMREAVSELANASNLVLDFYDSVRLATWVRDHPSLILWVREKIAQPIAGWKPYENWAHAPGGIEEEYILDDGVRVYDGTGTHDNHINALEAVNRLRTILHNSSASIRLVGLSGVGKTRLLQALFDERVGNNPLNPDQVFYTDMALGPDPIPQAFATQLIALRQPAILAIDNCTPELHRTLTHLCCATNSMVKLITVEYDVRDDTPEETQVFRLEPASVDLIEKLVSLHFPDIGQVNARTIADFSGGNARIALALGNTVRSGESLGHLRDEELFRRLFVQRHNSEASLLESAAVCALVYSFECPNGNNGSLAELEILGTLINKNSTTLFRDIAALQERGLVQQRTTWRAILPHAIANRLATWGLKHIPTSNIITVFEQDGAERLLQSFSRRLGYLHESPIAVQIVTHWLSDSGLLSNVNDLNDLGIALLENTAPVVPELTLQAIERAANGQYGDNFISVHNRQRSHIILLLRSLAYNAELFERCVNLLCRFALAEDKHENHNSAQLVLESLFHILLSGTHATLEQRLSVASRLVQSKSEQEQRLGMVLLRAGLKARFFTSFGEFEFGSHARDYGYTPRGQEERKRWFSGFLSVAEIIATSESPIREQVRSILAEAFRDLWMIGDVEDELEKTTTAVVNTGPWGEGWHAVLSTIFFRKKTNSEFLGRLRELETLLKPKTLLDQARVYLFTKQSYPLSVIGAEDEEGIESNRRSERVQKLTQEIGVLVAQERVVFEELLPDLVTHWGNNLVSFGNGLAEGTLDPVGIWSDLRRQLSKTNVDERQYSVVCGFIASISKSNPELAEKFLDHALTDEVWGICFPILQTSVDIYPSGITRLIRSTELDISPAWTYRWLGERRNCRSISDDDFCKLLDLLMSKSDGISIAIENLETRIFQTKSENLPISDSIKSFGRELLTCIVFDDALDRRGEFGWKLGDIADTCLESSTTAESAKVLATNLTQALAHNKIFSQHYTNLLKSLAQKHPIIFLDSFLRDFEGSYDRFVASFWAELEGDKNPLVHIDDEVLIEWCEREPEMRYQRLALCIVPFEQSGENEQYVWTSLALKIMDSAPNTNAVLDSFRYGINLVMWNGSRADELERRLKLVIELKSHTNPSIMQWASSREQEFISEIRLQRQRERAIFERRYTRFE